MRHQKSLLADGTAKALTYYQCRSISEMKRCAAPSSWRAELIHETVERHFLDKIGDWEEMKRTFVPGRDRTGTIAELRLGVRVHLPDERVSNCGAFRLPDRGSEIAEAFLQTLKRLESEPVVKPRWIEEPTGATYRQRWLAAEEWGSKAELLVRAGVRFFCEGSHKTGTVHVYLPERLRDPAEGSDNGAGEAEGQNGQESRARQFLSELRRSKGMDPVLWDYRR